MNEQFEQQIPPQPSQLPASEGQLKTEPISVEAMLPEVKPEPPKSRKILVVALILVLGIALIGGGALAYVSGYIPFLQRSLTPEEVIDRMLGSIVDIKSASYETKMEFKSEARDAGARTWEEIIPEFKEKKSGLENDTERLSNLLDIQNAIRGFYVKNNRDPESLEELAVSESSVAEKITDPKTGQKYGYRQESGGLDYVLHIEMETDEAIETYRKGAQAQGAEAAIRQGNVIEVTKDTPSVYVYADSSEIAPYPVNLNIDNVYQYLPVEVDGALSASGHVEIDSTQKNDASYNMSGTLAPGGMTFSAGMDIRKKDNDYYLRINEAPSLGFFDLAALKQKWIKVEPEEVYNTYLQEADSGKDGLEEKSEMLARQYQLILQEMQLHDLIYVVNEFPREKEGDDSLYHYQIKLDREKIAGFYEGLSRKMESQFGDSAVIKFNEKTNEYLQGEEFARAYDALDENVSLELWVDAKNFWPRRISYSQRMVPPDSIKKLEGKQYRFTMTAGMADVNEPFTVDAPAEYMSVEEAKALLSGQSSEEEIQKISF